LRIVKEYRLCRLCLEAACSDPFFFPIRDCFGGGTLVNDLRWAGSYGIQADFVAMSHCSIDIIKTSDIQVTACTAFQTLAFLKLSAKSGYSGKI
jgi:hypothetical protein